MKKVTIDKSQVIGYGANGVVYRLGQEQIVKVYTENTTLEDIRRERRCAQEALKADIPTAITFDIVDCGGSYGLVFEDCGTDTFASYVSRQPQEYEAMKEAFAELFCRLHTIEVRNDEFTSVKDLYTGFIEACGDWYEEGELDLLKRLVQAIPDRRTIIHGDFHGKNIMIYQGDLLLIDMGDVSYGHPVFDLIMTGATQINLVRLNPEFAEAFNGLKPEYTLDIFRRLVRDTFSLKEDQELDDYVEFTARLSKLKVALAPALARHVDPEIIRMSVDDARANLIPYIDELMATPMFRKL